MLVDALREVAVIGAGAAGLSASRHLAKAGMRPILFERTLDGVGGLWNSSSGRTWDTMVPNLSRHTCCFSELPWDEDTSQEATANAFPNRVELQQYLQRYSNRFLEKEWFRMGCTVTRVERLADIDAEIQKTDIDESNDSGSIGGAKYRLEWTQDDKTHHAVFDGVVITSGFFSEPTFPKLNDSSTTNTRTPHIHSSQYSTPEPFTGSTVAIIGSSFSALEIAADVAKCAQKVVHIMPRIPWVLPRLVPVPQTGSSPAFVPIDTAIYRRTRDLGAPNQENPPSLEQEDVNIKKHAFIRSLVGTQKQSILGIPSDDHLPPHVAISDTYLDRVANGKIDVVHGRLIEINHDTLTILATNNETITRNGIDQLISCTGYRPSLDFLSPELQTTLNYDPMDTFQPLILCHDIYHPDLPGLGFVGMYRGPYFGVLELQARLLAQRWSSELGGGISTSDNEALKQSQHIRDARPRPQFPHGDYIAHMDSLASVLGCVPPKGRFGSQAGEMVLPALYQPDNDLAETAIAAFQTEVTQCHNGKYTTSCVLNALVGKWKFHRTIQHFNAYPPRTDTISGTISFSVRDATGSPTTLLYREDGLYHTPKGDFEVFREYEYRHNTENNCLELFFVESGETTYLFLSLNFGNVDTDPGDAHTKRSNNNVFEATSDHLCINDLYKGTFRMEVNGIMASQVEMEYNVKGPEKDYTAITTLVPL